MLTLSAWCRAERLFVEGFGDGGAGGGLVDDGLAGCVGGDECLEAEVVDGAGVAAAGLLDQRGGVVAEQRVGPPAEGEVVGDVAGGLGGGHGGHGVAQADPLVEGGQDGELHGAAQGGCPIRRQAIGESESMAWLVSMRIQVAGQWTAEEDGRSMHRACVAG